MAPSAFPVVEPSQKKDGRERQAGRQQERNEAGQVRSVDHDCACTHAADYEGKKSLPEHREDGKSRQGGSAELPRYERSDAAFATLTASAIGICRNSVVICAAMNVLDDFVDGHAC
jgi:hypothetical protein